MAIRENANNIAGRSENDVLSGLSPANLGKNEGHACFRTRTLCVVEGMGSILWQKVVSRAPSRGLKGGHGFASLPQKVPWALRKVSWGANKKSKNNLLVPLLVSLTGYLCRRTFSLRQALHGASLYSPTSAVHPNVHRNVHLGWTLRWTLGWTVGWTAEGRPPVVFHQDLRRV